MAEYIANAVQTVNPGESVIFTTTKNPCTKGYIRHDDGTGSFLCAGVTSSACPCVQRSNYFVDFGANIAIPTGGDVEAISLAFAVDGSTVPATIMTVTPAAVEEFANVSRAANVGIWKGCCQTVSVRNVSEQPILVQNANIVFRK